MITTFAAGSVQTASSASGFGGLLLITVVWAAIYVGSLLLHPHTHCRTCEGTPRSYGSVYTHAFLLCDACGGRGRQHSSLGILTSIEREALRQTSWYLKLNNPGHQFPAHREAHPLP
jgi:hypothetical protein